MKRVRNKGYINVDFERIAGLAEDIVFSEKDSDRVLSTCYSRLDGKGNRPQNLYHRAAAVVIILILTVVTAVMVNKPDVLVYASSISGEVKLKTGESVILKKQFTPLGMGYVLTLDTKETEFYYTVESEDNVYSENIFRNGNTIYWLPDGSLSGKLSDENGEIIYLPKTNKSILKIRVHNKEAQVENITLSLERRGDVCSAELLK